MKSKQYKHSPLVEVLCEFQFEQDTPWDLTIPGIIYEGLKENFPTRRQATRITLGLPSPGDTNPQISSTQITQFWSVDEKSLIQVGPYLLSVNRLNPYPSWENFLPMIENGFKTYCDVAYPNSIRSIALRYINSIKIEGKVVNLDQYFEFRPFVGPNLPQTHGPFTQAIQIPFEDGRDILTLQLGSITGSAVSDILTINLDLTYSLAKSGEVALNGVSKWVEKAHEHIKDVFEASITRKLKEEFGEELD